MSTCEHVYFPGHLCEGQRLTLWSYFSPFTFTWLQGLESGFNACEGCPLPTEPSLYYPKLMFVSRMFNFQKEK